MVTQLLSLPLSSLTNVNCWLATIPSPLLSEQGVRLDGVERTAGLMEAMVLFKNLFINITCIECTSPGVYDLAELLMTEEGSKGTTNAANSLLDYATSLLDGEFLQIFLDRAINEAPARCPHNPAYDPDFKGLEFESFDEVDLPSDSISFLLAVVIASVGILVVFVLVSYLVRCFVRRRNRRWLTTLPTVKVFRIYGEQKREDEKANYLRQATSAMISSEDVPTIVRYMIPVVILGNIALFLSGHLSIGGAVSVYLQFAGEEIVLENIFVFSVAQSAMQLWEAGGKQLAIMILIFSGVWPYTKQIITLIAWFLPPQRLSVGRRGSIFIWLDALAKWSSADIFFLIVSLAAFNINVQSPKVSYLPDEFYSVDILLIPLWGLYSNLIAQLLSQLSSHVIIHYHRKIVEKALNRMGCNEEPRELMIEDGEEVVDISDLPTQEDCRAVSPPEKLHEHGFLRPHRGIKDQLTIRRGVNMLLIGTALTLVVLITVGCFLPSFSFEQLGLLGVAVEVGRGTEEARNQFSVFGIAKTLIDQGLFLGTASSIIGMLVIAMLLIMTIFVVPLLQIGALLYQWFWPIKQIKRGRLEVFIEILSAWQYLEVYLLSVLVSAWQLGPTSEYLINSYCENLTDTFSALVFFGIIREEDAQCFKLSASIEDGCFVLIAAAFLLAFFHTFVTKAVFQHQRDKAAEERRQNEQPDAKIQHLIDTMDVDKARETIHPTPVLFSDTFRWLLDSTPLPTSTPVDYLPDRPEQIQFDQARRSSERLPSIDVGKMTQAPDSSSDSSI